MGVTWDTEEKRLYYGERDLQASGWYRVNPGGTGNAGGSREIPPQRMMQLAPN